MSHIDDRIRAAVSALAEQISVAPLRLEQPPPRKEQPTRRLGAVVLAGAVAAALLLFLLIDDGRDEESLRTVDQGEDGCPREESGNVYLVAGPSNTNAVLYQGSLCGGDFVANPSVTRAKGVSSNGDLVVVTYERGGVQKLISGAPEPFFDFVPSGPVTGASVSADGLLAYVTSQPIEGGAATDRLHVYDPKTATSRAVFADNRFLSHPSWGPDGSIAVYRDKGLEGEAPDVAIVRPDGRVRSFPLRPTPSLSLVEHLLWAPADQIAVAYNTYGPDFTSVLLDPVSGDQQEFHGWHALAWSPDASTLLIQKGPADGELAVVRAPDFDDPRDVGPAPAYVFGAAWLPCSAASPCSPAPEDQEATSAPATKELNLSDLLSLADQGRVKTVDIYESSALVTGEYFADDGAETGYQVRIPSSTSQNGLVSDLLGRGTSVTIHEPSKAAMALRLAGLLISGLLVLGGGLALAFIWWRRSHRV